MRRQVYVSTHRLPDSYTALSTPLTGDLRFTVENHSTRRHTYVYAVVDVSRPSHHRQLTEGRVAVPAGGSRTVSFAADFARAKRRSAGQTQVRVSLDTGQSIQVTR